MSRRASELLELEVAQMESRLATAKATIELEKEAWKRIAHKGRQGTKWKGAAGSNTKGGKGPGNVNNHRASGSDVEVVPAHWDALELAHHLQSQQLTGYAQVVIYEQITGKLLLDTPPSKLRQLFQDVVLSKNDPSWKSFLHTTSQLHKLQKTLGRASAGGDKETTTTKATKTPIESAPPPLFPAISPRPPMVTASSMATKASTSDMKIALAQDSHRYPAVAKHHQHKPVSSTHLQLVSCWNCGARFPRGMAASSANGGLHSGEGSKSAKHLSLRIFCSKSCQQAIEQSEMSISASVSLSTRNYDDLVSDHPIRQPTRTTGSTMRSPRAKPTALPDSFDFLHVSRRGVAPSPTELPHPPTNTAKTPSGRLRFGAIISTASARNNGSAAASSSFLSVAPVVSIPLVRTLPDGLAASILAGTGQQSNLQSRVFEQSLYRLDPDLFMANGVHFLSCFDASTPSSPTQHPAMSQRAVNLRTLTQFLSIRAMYRLSLSSRKWFELIHICPGTVEVVWSVHLTRSWRSTPADETRLQSLGVLSKKHNDKCRRVMMKLTRQIQKTVLENMKVLSQVGTWQLAAICQADTEYSSVLQGTDYFRPSWTDADLLDGALDELYEVITMIVNEGSGAIVAIRAKELIRPIAEEGTVTEILQGLRSGSLWTIDCRRLRLFSSTNRLNHDQWHLLPRIQTVVEFCWTLPDNGEDSSPALDTWHTRLLGKLQKQMQARFLAKESMQYVMKWVHDTNSPQQALVALEAFVLHHTPKKHARRGKVKG